VLGIDGSGAPDAGFAATVERTVTPTVLHTYAAVASSSDVRICRGEQAHQRLPATTDQR